MKVQACEPDPAAAGLLGGAQFIDSFMGVLPGPAIDARTAAERMFALQPRWILALMALRNLIVSPFGLKTGRETTPSRMQRIGIFPLISESPDKLIAGMDDRHLDFRVLVSIDRSASPQRVTATTAVRTHNLLGRIYLKTITPFHRVIVPSMLKQIDVSPAAR